jgi:acetyltransferase-like isoleucine patch superfamily enzyme
MRKALGEIGWRGAWRFLGGTLASGLLAVCVVPPVRALLLRLFGATLGSDCIVHRVRFFNLYRTGFRGLRFGDRVFVGEDCLLDLADEIRLEREVTLGERVTLLTHVNVGYFDHPLQAHFPRLEAPVTIRSGSFLGAGVTVLPGVSIGPEAFVAAGSVVTADVGRRELVAGVPARVIRRIGET